MEGARVFVFEGDGGQPKLGGSEAPKQQPALSDCSGALSDEDEQENNDQQPEQKTPDGLPWEPGPEA